MSINDVGVGTTSSTALTLNIPDEYIHEVMWFGAASYLFHNEQEQAFARESYEKYVRFRRRIEGEINIDEGISDKDEAQFI